MDLGLWVLAHRFELVLAAVWVASITQPNAPRLYAALCFCGFSQGHDILFGAFDGLAYFGTAALSALGIMLATAWVDPVPKLAITLHHICGAAIIFNGVGFLLWYFYISGIYYSTACLCLYLWALYSFIQRDPQDDMARGFGRAQWLSCFRFDRGPRLLRTQGSEAET